MPDRTIPFYNIILKCSDYKSAQIRLPEGFRFRKFQKGDEKTWAALEWEIGDFASLEEAEQYFLSVYCSYREEIEKRCIFVVDEKDRAAGSCIAWRDEKNGRLVSSLHWLVVSPACQGRKLGRALCQKTMEIFQRMDGFPVYIHTQPWSYKAILLYIQQGFQLQITDTFSDYQNQYTQAMHTLKEILTKEQYDTLTAHSV